jgi:hypothetical protein
MAIIIRINPPILHAPVSRCVDFFRLRIQRVPHYNPDMSENAAPRQDKFDEVLSRMLTLPPLSKAEISARIYRERNAKKAAEYREKNTKFKIKNSKKIGQQTGRKSG